MHGSTIFVSLTDADDDWPFLIENDSGYRFSLAQSVRIFMPYAISQTHILYRKWHSAMLPQEQVRIMWCNHIQIWFTLGITQLLGKRSLF